MMDRVKRALGWALRHSADLLFVLLAALLVLWVASDAFTTRVVTTSQGADYWEHSATLNTLIEHPFRPRNPHLVSPAASPRFVPLFIGAALLARMLDYGALDAMGIVATLNTLLFVVGIFCFFRSYFRDARASLIGLVVLFCSWYDAWHFSNVYQIKIFFSTAPYPSTTALGLSLLGFTLTLRVLRGQHARFGVAWLTLCWATVAVTHPLTAMMGFAGAALLALTEPNVAWRLRLKVALSVPLGLALSFLWPYFSMRRVLINGGQEQVEGLARSLAGAALEEAGGKLHQFYRQAGIVRTLGAALLGVPVALYLLVRRRRLLIPLGAISMLAPFVVNAYVPLPLGHRFILLAVFFLQLGVVWLLLRFTPHSPEAFGFVNHRLARWFFGAAVLGVLGVLAWFNVGAAMERVDYSLRRFRGGGTSANVRYAARVAQLAGPDAVILGRRAGFMAAADLWPQGAADFAPQPAGRGRSRAHHPRGPFPEPGRERRGSPRNDRAVRGDAPALEAQSSSAHRAVSEPMRASGRRSGRLRALHARHGFARPLTSPRGHGCSR
ncbi:MAG: hypothetical protein QM756_03945 [Polyangiaceae bacterium]